MNIENTVLIIIDTQGEIRQIDLQSFEKSELILGRDDTHSDIVISDPIVSKRHGLVSIRGRKIYYQDLDSKNGTYVSIASDRKLLYRTAQPEELTEGAVLRIGAVTDPNKLVLLYLTHMSEEESWHKLSLSTERITIGRTAENNIILDHPSVSRAHCIVQRFSDRVVLYDGKSTNGTLINGKAVNHEHILKDKDVIQILGYQLIFSGECIYYKTKIQGIHIHAKHINKWVGRSEKKKQILRDVSCEIKGNEFVAIIGGSGAGKSTLMNAISGFDKSFSGNVYCNNIDLVENFQHLKNIMGFVPQEDIIYENLTLRKMLYYTAKLKMPDDIRAEEIERRMDEVLDMVELREHQNTYIRKLSGGQKKRASIAVELLADPKLFFLDEPTSGLDPGTEKNLMQTLKALAKKQEKTIVMVTHTTQSLSLCDKIIFMGPGGRLCFFGNVDEAKRFFATDDLTNAYNMVAEKTEYWEQKFSGTQPPPSKERLKEKTEALKGKRTSAIRQFSVLIQRYVELMKNDIPRLFVLLLQPLIIGGLLYIVADNDVFKIYESTKSMLFALSCAGIWLGVFDSIQEICKERAILKREYMANLKLPGYMLSKFFVQAVLGLIQSILLTGIFLLLLGENKKGIFFSHFHFELFLTVWLTILSAIAMGFVISAMVRTGDKAMAIAPFILIIQLLFSGILFELKGVGEKISYCTISRWSVEALGSISRLNKMDLRLQAEIPKLSHEAESFFEATQAHVIGAWAILVAMTLLFIIISVLLLKNLSKDSR